MATNAHKTALTKPKSSQGPSYEGSGGNILHGKDVTDEGDATVTAVVRLQYGSSFGTTRWIIVGGNEAAQVQEPRYHYVSESKRTIGCYYAY